MIWLYLNTKDVWIVRKIKDIYNRLPLPLRASIWFFFGAALEKGIAFIILPVFSRLLSTEQYGLVTLYNSWLQIVCIFTTLNLQYGSLGTAQIKFEKEKYSYSVSIQMLVMLICFIALFVVRIFSSFFQDLFKMPLYLINIMIIESWAIFVIGLWNGNKRFEYNYRSFIFVTLTVSIVTSVLGVIGVMNTKCKAEVKLFTTFGFELVMAIFLFVKILKRGTYALKKVYWEFALKNNIPLMPYYFSKIIFNTSDKIIIAKIVGNDKAGIYGLVYMLAYAIDFIRTAINNAYGPWFYSQIKCRCGEKARAVNRSIICVLLYIYFVFIMLGPELVWIIGGINYYEARWIIPFVSISLLFLTMADFACYIEFYFEKKLGLAFFTVISALVNVILNYICIPCFGYMVASVTTLISYMVLWGGLALCATITCKENKLSQQKYLDVSFQIKIGFVGIVLIIISVILYTVKYIRYVIIIVSLIVGLIYVVKVMPNKLNQVLENNNKKSTIS